MVAQVRWASFDYFINFDENKPEISLLKFKWLQRDSNP